MPDEQQPRKATDVLLDLEVKVDMLIGIVKTQDMNMKIISNKLTELMKTQNNVNNVQPRFSAETVYQSKTSALQPNLPQMPGAEPERNVPIFAENALQQIESPQGDRRVIKSNQNSDGKIVQQRPLIPSAEVQIPEQTSFENKQNALSTAKSKENQPFKAPKSAGGEIPVIQRCVDKSSKAIFMAEVKITDLSNGEQIFKTRTSANGKWTAPLKPGSYRVVINRPASLNKPQLEATQDVQVIGNGPTQELPMIIIK